MGLFFKAHRKHAVPKPHFKKTESAPPRLRLCRFEQMEPRQLLSTTPAPLHVGATYFEDSNETDQSSVLQGTTTQVADLFEVSFAGGAAGTSLTKMTIDLDNTFFNTASGGGGAYGYFPLTILSHTGFDITSSTVTNGGTKLEMTFSGLDAGEKLVFTIDVDENGNLQANAVAEGAELEGATLTTTFTAPHMVDITSTPVIFYDKFNFQNTGLENLLPNDNYDNSPAQAYVPENCSPGPVYTAGANGSLQQTPKPITLSGRVYEDFDVDNKQDTGEPGIVGVQLDLYELDGGDYVFTGKTTLTDANGDYKFTGLEPGTYRVVETQPIDYLSVGDTPGTVGGVTRGVVTTVDILSDINLDGGDDSIRNDFAEARPAELSGYVYHDVNNNGTMDQGEEGIGDVHLVVENTVTHTTYDAYTDADGYWYVDSLMPGSYKVTEYQPDGWIDGKDVAGTAGGTADNPPPGDMITGIVLVGGQSGQDYDFGELKPASVSGYVYVDANDNGIFDDGETPIAGVTITLLDASGNSTGKTQSTNQAGYYQFDNLTPGTYGVAETQPAEYYDGKEHIGSAGGQNLINDNLTGANLGSGTSGIHYDFGELVAATISGHVYVDANRNGTFDKGETPLAGVTVTLLDASGNPTSQTRTTDSSGFYEFAKLKPGKYGVAETQPAGYLDGDEHVGSAGGSNTVNDKITGANLSSGTSGIDYDFGEIIPAKISGYVFQDGPVITKKQGEPDPYIPSVRDGKLTPDDKRLAGIRLVLCDGNGVPLFDSQNNAIATYTDASGYYEFTGLEPGVYSIMQVQPTNYIPGIDTAGAITSVDGKSRTDSTGVVVNSYSSPDPTILSTLSVDASGSAIVRITLNQGDVAAQYNFSEVLVQSDPPTPPNIPVPPLNPPTQPPPAPQFAGYQPVGVPYSMPPQVVMQPMFGGSGGPGGYSWHLSIINASQPRRDGSNDRFTQFPQNTLFDPLTWTGADVNQSEWLLADENGTVVKTVHFGMPNAVPVTGDWDGTGTTKVGVFIDGLWFLDINGNDHWDENDLWAKLGKRGDQPVSGDWDGDGKTDIGIFGPAWIGDVKAISVEPGLPDAANLPNGRLKNVPPDAADAAVGFRTMKKGNGGRMRSDVIDHVFEYGTKGDRAVTGDWNGSGIKKIGIFRNGVWFLDMDGNGRWSDRDLVIEFGREGDIPVVGDWTGDGITKLGVYRDGKFILDTNNNHEIDAADKVFELGHAGDKPVVGDWTGDGVDKVGVYHETAAVPAAQSTASAQ